MEHVPFKAWCAGVGGIVLMLLWLFSSSLGMGYMMEDVGSGEMAVRIDRNQPVEVLGPGVYTDWGPWNLFRGKRLVQISVTNMRFEVTDEEILTKDKQRIGMTMAGDARLPIESEVILANWPRYGTLYQSPTMITGPTGIMTSIGGQAFKVCGGDNTFDNLVIGSARDAASLCLMAEVTERAAVYGITISNVVIPNVTISKEVQAQLDSITQARLAATLADQRALEETAKAKQLAAQAQGAIIVEQGQIQERAIQDAKTAALQVDAQKARAALLLAQTDNESLALAFARIQRQTRAEMAQADLAGKLAEAQMYQANPTFASLQMTQAMAGAYKNTDKVIVVPEGTNPVAFLGDSGRATAVVTTGR